MATVEGVSSAVKNSVIGKLGMGSAINLGFAYFDYKGRISRGENPLVAGALSAGSAYLGLTMGAVPYFLAINGYGLAKAGVSAMYSNYQNYNTYTRRMTTPFSHSFSHTDATYQAQQRGLQSISGARSGMVGAEAGMMAQLYSRR